MDSVFAGDTQQIVADRISFYELCQIFDEIKTTTKDKKGGIFKKFVRKWHENLKKCIPNGSNISNDTFYGALRLFIPSYDADRKFEIGPSILNRLVSDGLQTSHQKNPTAIPIDLLIDKLATEAAMRVCGDSPKLSIARVNEFLDKMNIKTVKQEQQQRIIVEISRNCTRFEFDWILHIITSDAMERTLGINCASLLNWFHPNALEYFKDGNGLRQICETYVGAEMLNGKGTLQADGNILCKPFRPMLLKRLDSVSKDLPKIIKYCKRPFYVETKFDGEHLLVHRYGHSQYKYFTRHGNDYTSKMGPDCSTKLSKRIHEFFRPEIQDCVLDCELLLWDKKLQSFVGKSKRASDGNCYDAKHLDDDFYHDKPFIERSLAVFDILFLNGEALLEKPLKERVKTLEERVFRDMDQDKSIIFIAKKEKIQTQQALVDFYNNAMRTGEEGIVIKGLESTYHPGSRSQMNGWFKIKPDYGNQSNLDLAVVGIRYDNATLSHITNFTVAARVTNSPDSNVRFKIISCISTRLKALEFKRLRDLLEGDGMLLNEVPIWIIGGKGTKCDRYVHRENIQVVEVRASGLIDGRLQFPSICSLRPDKRVEEIDTVESVAHFDERLRSRPIVNERDPHEAALLLNRRKRQQLKLRAADQLVKRVGDEQQISDVLKARKVRVINANGGTSPQDLQKILISMGAIPIFAGSDASFVVAMDPKPIQCAAAIKRNEHHIVHGNWLLRCRDRGTILPWQQSDMIHASPNAKFDLFTLPESMVQEEMAVAPHEVQEEEASTSVGDEGESDEALVRMADEIEREEKKYYETFEPSGEDCEPAINGNLFSGFVFLLHSSVKGDANRVWLADKIEAQKGRMGEELNGEVTHVVIAKMKPDEAEELFVWNEKKKEWLGEFVDADWVEKAIAEEDRYRLAERLHQWID